MKYNEFHTKSACNKVSNKNLPYKWDLNIYRGCEHGCKYCFAIYTNQYLNSNNFTEEIFIKSNIIEMLENQLNSKKWKHELINLGGITDSYQPIEKQMKIMPEIIKLLINYKTPCTISTKSALILRDKDLLNKLSDVTYVNIAITITTLNDKLRSMLEPYSSTIEDRIKIIESFSSSHLRVGIHIMPIMPFINDDIDSLEEIFCIARKYNVDYIDTEPLNLFGPTKFHYFTFLKRHYPNLISKYDAIFTKGRVSNDYIKNLNFKIDRLREKYNYPKLERKDLNKIKEHEQLTFF
ncbi:SPL family radical SAM protein [Paraclostridium bifermentans]|uniref:SPL family radical SAM protein n=1 Tax=Paraclostridium bifermentans TaxID=1490 RepID=UPI002910D24D|nr:radical SAM protein [Paraclostridium bifermentans]MDU3338027.1 radical SAM protein [Paraclostridium bifermentans]